MTSNISVVAACCWRASCNSLCTLEIKVLEVHEVRRFLPLMSFLRPLTELALRAFAALGLPPLFDGRAMFPLSQEAYLIESSHKFERAETVEIALRCVGFGSRGPLDIPVRPVRSRKRTWQMDVMSTLGPGCVKT